MWIVEVIYDPGTNLPEGDLDDDVLDEIVHRVRGFRTVDDAHEYIDRNWVGRPDIIDMYPIYENEA